MERFAREASTVVSLAGCSLASAPRARAIRALRIGTVTGEGITSPRHFAAAAVSRDPVSRDADIELIVRIVLRVLAGKLARWRRDRGAGGFRPRAAGARLRLATERDVRRPSRPACCGWRRARRPPHAAGARGGRGGAVRLVVGADAARPRRRPRSRRAPDRGALAPAAGRARRALRPALRRRRHARRGAGELVVTASAAAARMERAAAGVAVDLAIIAALGRRWEVPAASCARCSDTRCPRASMLKLEGAKLLVVVEVELAG